MPQQAAQSNPFDKFDTQHPKNEANPFDRFDSSTPHMSDVIQGLRNQYWEAARNGDTKALNDIYEKLKAAGSTPGGFDGRNGSRDIGTNAADRFEIGYGHAGIAAGQTIEQLGRHIGSALGITSPQAANAADNAIKTQANTYEQGVGSTLAGKAGNFTGDVLNTAPALEASIPAKGASLLSAAGRGALVAGGVNALTQPVTSGAGGFAGKKAGQVATAAAIGGGIPVVGRTAMRVGENLLPGNIVQSISNQFMRQANKKPFASESEALSGRTGIEFTPGQVSGAKMQTGLENLSRQSLFSADKAFEADTKVANQAVDYINRTMNKISPERVSNEGVGEKVQSTLRNVVSNIAKHREQNAAKQYGAISKALGDTPVVRYDNTKKVLSDMLNEYQDVPGQAAASMRKQLEGMLQDIEKKPAFSLNSAQMARSAYGRAARGSADIFKDVKTSEQARIAKRLYGAMTDDIEQSAAALDGGPRSGPGLMLKTPNGMISQSGLAQAWRSANDNYRNYSKLIDAVEISPIKRLIGDKVDVGDFMTVNKIPPEKVIKTLGSMSPSEIKIVRTAMEKAAPDTWNEYKRLLVQNALDEAQTFPGSSGANPIPLDANKFIRVLGGNHPAKIEKLRAVFSPQEMSQINDAFMALRRLGDKFGTNFSGTAAANEALGLIHGGIRGAVKIGSTTLGMRNIAKVMLNSDGRKALVKMSRLPPQSRQFASLAGYIASLMESQGSGDTNTNDQVNQGTPDEESKHPK